MPRADRLAVLLSLLGFVLSAWITDQIYERIPHIEDEMAYAWQAQVINRGQVTLPSPAYPKSMLVPFVVDYHGQRFGKYPLGWPVVLAWGIRLGIRHLVNPILAALGVWFTYRLGKKIFGEGTGLLAAGLTITSPFFMMNSGSLLSHPWSLFLTLTFSLAWLDTTNANNHLPKWLTTLVSGFSLGVLILTRPLTALGIALPFVIHGLYLLWRGPRSVRIAVLAVGLLGLGHILIHLIWQFALTGDPFTNPYTLWWPYDKVGFGPGVGRQEGGYNIQEGLKILEFNLWYLRFDLFGWAGLSWLFLPIGVWAARKNRPAWLIGSIPISLALTYMGYWMGTSLYGPRYYYEGLPGMAIFSAAGIIYLSGLPWNKAMTEKAERSPRRGRTAQIRMAFKRGIESNLFRRARAFATILATTLLVVCNLIYYVPARVGGMRGFYGVSAARLRPFETPGAAALAPALIIVHPIAWTEYGSLLDLQSPFEDSPFIFAYSRSELRDQQVSLQYPNRRVYHYYPDDPYRFFINP